MNFLKVLWSDICNIFQNRFVRASVIAVILIPLVYGGLYLAAFWDPYGKTENLPVALVNLDKGGMKDDKKVNYGEDMVDKLKYNDDLAWKFVKTQKEAEEGLKGDKYYAMIVIPKDFSQRLLDVENGKLQRPKFMFVANKKKNYVVGLITDKASKALRENAAKSVVNNFGESMFDKLYEIRDGMEAAADGTSQIRDGVTDLKDKVPTMSDGMDKLHDGATTLNDKLKDASDGSNKLRDGLGTLNGKMPDLVDGANKAYKGSGDLSRKIKDALDGSNTLRDGTIALNDKLPDLNKGINDLYDGTTSLKEALGEVHDNMPKLVDGVSDLKDGSKKLRDGLKDLSTGTETLQQSSPEIEKMAKDKINSSIKQGFPQVLGGLDMLIKNLAPMPNLQKPLEEVKDGLSQYYNGGNPDISDISKLSSDLSNSIKTLKEVQSQIDNIIKANPALESTLAPVKAALQKLTEGMEKSQGEIEKPLKLLGGISELNGGASKLYDGSKKLYDGLDELYEKSLDLRDGTETIYNGSQNLRDGISKFRGSVPELQNGVSVMCDGTTELSSGLFKINESSKKLYDGLGELSQKVPDAQDAVQQLYDGSTDLSDGIIKLWDGSGKLKDGLKTLVDKMPDLKDGTNKLYEGVAQLNDKLKDGASELADKLVPGSKAIGKFMSDPINLKDKPMFDVEKYGEGMAPYFISLSLWVGSIMMFFVINEKVNSDIKVGPAGVVLGKYLSYCTLGVLQAIFISAVVLKLGLHPTNLKLYFGFNIFLSLVFIAIIQNFIFLFGDVGRLLSIIVLVLQLTSSNGTFPGELLPKFFKAIGPYLPFTYSISAMREINSGIDSQVLMKDITILAAMWFVFLTLSVLLKRHSDKFNLKVEDQMHSIHEKEIESEEKVHA